MPFDWTNPWVMIGWAWALWLLSWMLASVWTRTTTARAGTAEIPHLILTIAGAYLLFPTNRLRFGPHWPVADSVVWAMFALILVGIAFAWWARLTLGTLWSGSVTRKEDHRVVESGPYALVRHPIYTGLLLSVFATAVARGETSGFVGAALIAAGFWTKARLEESFLSKDLGSAYADYRRRVKMLVPFIV